MNQLFRLLRSQKANDVLGVMRGLAKVGGQIIKRIDHMPEDAIYLAKSVEKQINSLETTFTETQEFLNTAEKMFNAGDGEEFVTFDKPIFQFKRKDEEASRKLMDEHFGESETSPKKPKPEDPVAAERSKKLSEVIEEAGRDVFYVPKGKSDQTTVFSESPQPLIEEISLNGAAQPNLATKVGPVKHLEPVVLHPRKQAYDFENYRKKKESDFSQVIEKKVPSNSISRAFEFTKVGSSILSSAVGGFVKNTVTFGDSKGFRDFALTEANAEKLAQALCKMRGAALKLGQAMSMQEDQFLPEPIKKAFNKARQSANIMPSWQLEKILEEAFGESWLTDNFKSFDMRPFAAASIGQVHKAVLKDGRRVVLKIQYPGVANSIDSDLDNLKRLMNYTGIFPKSMFLDDFISNTRVELKEECNYTLEAEKQMRYHELAKSIKNVSVPQVIRELSRANILTMEEIEGIDLDTCAKELSQEERNFIGAKVMEVTLKEIFDWRFMQTDPNFANFFYNPNTETLFLLDFGAAREYDFGFCKNYLDTVFGASNNDPALIYKATKELGFLSGEESEVMKAAHIESIIVVGQPFSKPGLFDFGNQSITKQIYDLMPVMLKNRLKAPPPEVYSLHRKLSGCYLINIHLKSSIPSRQIFTRIHDEVAHRYQTSD